MPAGIFPSQDAALEQPDPMGAREPFFESAAVLGGDTLQQGTVRHYLAQVRESPGGCRT